MKKVGILLVTVIILAGIILGIIHFTKDSESDIDSSSNETFETPEDFIKLFINNEFELIYEYTGEQFQASVTLEELKQLGENFNQGVNEYELVSVVDLQGQQLYQWMDDEGSKGVRAYISDDLTIDGILISPIAANLDTDEVYTVNKYTMPINEEWYVLWGGTNELLNYHYPLDIQRYAYDLIIVKDGYSYEDDPTTNESYYAFGKEVVAPLDGIVVATENSIKDNTPLVETNSDQPLGNYVVIEHENGEYSIIAHFKEGSVVVKEGDEVVAGEVIGLVGNSGNSSEPHIHFQISDGPDLFHSTSLRIQFEDDNEPIQGEFTEGY